MSTEDEVLVDDKGEIITAPEEKEHDDDVSEATGEDERPVQHAEDDEQGHAEESTEDAEARRERNRKRRAENKANRKEYVESLKRELASRDELLQAAMTRLDAVERRTSQTDIAAVDQEIKKTADAYNYFKNQIAIAVQAQNGAVVADATEKMQQAQRRYDQLHGIKNAVARQSQAPQPLDPRMKSNAEAWLAKNSWYDPQAKDTDSRIMKELDQSLAEEGWNPTTEAYWKELDARKKKYLPHRADSSYNRGNQSKDPSRGSPVAGSGREATSGTESGAYKLSAARVQAIKDAGAWDDPTRRAAMVKRFKEYDKQNAA